jgi:aspartate/methionine/tyrosine aminotransferase
MPNFIDVGIDTSWDNFLDHEKDAEEELKGELAILYGTKKTNILITVGATEGIFIVSGFFSACSRRIIVKLPEYEPLFIAPRALGMKVAHKVTNIEKGDSFSASLPNNPTGSLDFESVLEKYNKDHMFHLGEAFREYLFDESRKTVFGKYDNVIISSTMTKFYGLDNLRVGWLISNEENIEKMKYVKNLTSIDGAAYSYWLATQALKNRPKFIERAKKLIFENRKMLIETLENIDKIEFTPTTMPFVFIKYKGMSSLKLCKLAIEKYGILIAPGKFFGKDYCFRACLTSEKNQFAVNINALSKFLKENL